ncbi:hypothetical protein EC991_000223 [Linnemannia zychae]|nr:hypothetical protein EC991_000223 [Linnemannia zychae]
MDAPSTSQENLIPLSLLSTSLFQRPRKSLSNAPNSFSSPVVRGHPIAVPQVAFTEILPPEDLLVKKEAADDRQLPLALPAHQHTTTVHDLDSETEETQMPVYNNYSSGPKDRQNYRESSMILDSRPHKETPKFGDRVAMSVPPPDRRYIDNRRDDGHSHNNNTRDNRIQRNDSARTWDSRSRDWDDHDRPNSSRGSDPFLQEQIRGGRNQHNAPPPPQSPQDRYDSPYTSEFSRHLERGRFFESGSNKRRNESVSPKPRKRTGSMTEDVRSGIAEVSLARNRSPEPNPNARLSNATLSHSQSSGDDSEYDRARQRVVTSSANPRSRSIVTSAAIGANGSADVDMSPRKPEFKSSSSKRKNKRRRTARETSGESSDSDSSSSESDSSSDESDTSRFIGASDLKLHGQINDLMLELERTRTKYAKYTEKARASSKRIRNISKKLERRFRKMSERPAVASSYETAALDRPMMVSRPSTDKVIQNTSTPSLSSKTSPAGPKNVSLNGKSGSSRSRLAQYNDRVTVAASDVVETLTNVHADIRIRTFGRKPRCMLHHVPIAGPDMEEVMVTSSLDGSIQLWDLERRRVTSTIQKVATDMPWAEDMCWVGKNRLAVASAHKEGVPMRHQLMLVHVEKTKPSSSVQWTVQRLVQKPHDNSKGGILCLSALTEDRSGLSLATAGMDKQIIRWKFTPPNSEGECLPSQQTLIHNKHTSTIQGLCYTPHNNVLFSGGCDCKVIGWDMERSEIVYDYKSKERGRINSITPNPVDHNLLLVSHATTNNQLSLHDLRQRFDDPVLRFGFECADNLSRQVMPSWHPGGAIVSSGTQSDPKINIWDIRWRDVHRGAGQSIDGQSKRVFKAAFHPTKPFITSMSADSSLAFIDFRLNPGTVVHR